ncbi:MAG: peptidyl-prolyl cis-trans isomerase [Candidatus Eisenbacteria bacterium]
MISIHSRSWSGPISYFRHAVLVVVFLLLSIVVHAAPATSAPPAPIAPGSDIVGVVEGISIRQFEWDRLATPYFREVEAEAGRKLSDDERRLLRQNVLRELVRERLWIADAKRRGMSVTEAELDARMKQSQFFKTNGRVDDAKFLAFKRSPASNYPELRAQLEMGLLLEKYLRWMEGRFGPRESELKQAFRERTSLATIRFLLLGPEAVSLDPESTEEEIRTYYDEHPADFQAPSEAHIQYVKIQQASEAAPGDSSREANALQSLRSAKDLLTAINAGAPPETAARIHGGFHDSGLFRIGDPIRGLGRSELLTDAVNSTDPGAWIREPVRVGAFHIVARVIEKKPSRVIPFRESIALSKRRADAAKRDAMIDSLARQEVSRRPDDYRRSRLVASVLARPLAAFEDPKPISAKDVGKALERARKAARVSDTARVWLDSVRTTLPALLAAERRTAAAAKAMREIAGDLRRGDPAERVALRRLASHSRVALWRGEPPAQPGLAEGAFLDSLYELRPGAVAGPRVARDSIFLAQVETIDPNFIPPFGAIRQEARSAALQTRRTKGEREAEVWFAERRERYNTPPRFIFDLVFFSKTRPDTTLVPDDSISTYHAGHPLEFTEPALVRSRHILITARASDPARVKDAARARTLALRARLRKGEDFAALAREASDDKGSAVRGGELGELLRSQLVPEFAAVAFSLPPGEVSEPVLTPYGYHLIRVDGRTEPRLRPLEECRSEIRKFLSEQLADTLARRGAEALIAAARDSATFSDLALAAGGARRFGPVGNNDRLGEVGPVLGLTDWLAPLADGAITPDGLFTPEGYLVARKISGVAPSPAPYAEVRERVLTDYQASRRRDMADSIAARLRESLAAGADLDSLAVRFGGLRTSKPFGRSGPIPDFARDGAFGRDSLFLEGVFSSKPGATLPSLQGPAGTLFAKVEAITEPPAADFAKRRDGLRRELVEQRTEAWTERLRSRATVSIRRPDLKDLDR